MPVFAVLDWGPEWVLVCAPWPAVTLFPKRGPALANLASGPL